MHAIAIDRSWTVHAALCLLTVLCLGGSAIPAGADDWRQWGGPNDDWSRPDSVLAESWEKDGPPRLWQRPLGIGYSGLVAADGALYTLYREDAEEIVVALDAATGKTRWQFRYPTRTYERNVLQFGQGPNATPLIVDDLLITIGYAGNLHALHRESGELAWKHNLIDDLGGKMQRFGYSVSPVLHKGLVVVAVGGAKGLVAFAPQDGSIRWQSQPVDISYAVPKVISVGGQDQIVHFAGTEVLGVVPGPDGIVEWRYPFRNSFNNNASEALWDGDSRLFIATQADAGASMLRLTRDGDKTRVEEVWKNPKVTMHFWPAVWTSDRMFASIGGQGAFLATIDPVDGKILSRERGFDRLKWLRAGEHLLALDAEGLLRLVKPSENGLEVLGETQLLEADAWTAPILVGSTLYARDKKTIVAVDLSPKRSEPMVDSGKSGVPEPESTQ